ncbi:MAG: hypothetical protein CMH76_09620 [Nitrospinae bacterium]|nr:hypothetical protein [Nitrospinota bacterium]
MVTKIPASFCSVPPHNVGLAKLEAEGNEVVALNSDERNTFERSVAPLMESYRYKFGAELLSLLEN